MCWAAAEALLTAPGLLTYFGVKAALNAKS